MTLLALLWIIFLFNLVTFGNGPVMVPLLQEELVETRGVLSLDQLLYAFAIARATPGQANMYVASVGYFLFGVAGAALATLAVVLPGYLMLPLLRVYDRVRANRTVGAFIAGLTAASVGLIFAATIGMAQDALAEPVSIGVFVLALGLLQVDRLPAILSVVAAALVGFGLHAVLA